MVLPRDQFDHALVEAAVRAGAEFRPGVRAHCLLRDGGRVVGVRTAGAEVAGRWVIAAGGAGCCRRWGPSRAHWLRSRIAWFEGASAVPGRIEVILDEHILPGYGWVFPERDGCVNVGVFSADRRAGPEQVRRILALLTERHLAARLAGARQLGPARTYPICWSPAVGHAAPPGLLLAGEANGLANPATGEGIYYALVSGALAAQTVQEADRLGMDAAEAGRLYGRRLRRAFWARLSYGRLIGAGCVRLVRTLARIGDTALTRLLTQTLLAWG
jgi:flavin-dependent dehydrogenase